MQKSTAQLSFSDLLIHQRKLKSKFFAQLDTIIDWNQIETEISRYYKKGKGVDGRPSYSGLLLFKMSLLQTWHGLSDYEVELQVNDSLSFMQFTGLSLEDSVPDHSVLSRLRSIMTKAGAYERLFETINKQLEANQILVKKGLIVDASITSTDRKPKGKKEYEIVEDRNEDTNSQNVNASCKEKVKPGVDTEAAWIKKAGKLHYGYKKHISVDDTHGLVLSVITTAANESDMNHIVDVVAKSGCAKGTRVKADKGYQSEQNKDELTKRGFKAHIMKKARRNKGLTEREKVYNRLISQSRFLVERTFAGIVRWFGAGKARYVGQAKMHTQHLLECMAHNLYRSPKIAITIPIGSRKLLG